jgi:hypothetical protein
MIFAMRGRAFPWTKANIDDYYYKLFVNQNESYFFDTHERKNHGRILFSSELKDLLVKLWRKELTLQEALAHPFITKEASFDNKAANLEF